MLYLFLPGEYLVSKQALNCLSVTNFRYVILRHLSGQWQENSLPEQHPNDLAVLNGDPIDSTVLVNLSHHSVPHRPQNVRITTSSDRSRTVIRLANEHAETTLVVLSRECMPAREQPLSLGLSVIHSWLRIHQRDLPTLLRLC
jgi:hypothetical protein